MFYRNDYKITIDDVLKYSGAANNIYKQHYDFKESDVCFSGLLLDIDRAIIDGNGVEFDRFVENFQGEKSELKAYLQGFVDNFLLEADNLITHIDVKNGTLKLNLHDKTSVSSKISAKGLQCVLNHHGLSMQGFDKNNTNFEGYVNEYLQIPVYKLNDKSEKYDLDDSREGFDKIFDFNAGNVDVSRVKRGMKHFNTKVK